MSCRRCICLVLSLALAVLLVQAGAATAGSLGSKSLRGGGSGKHAPGGVSVERRASPEVEDDGEEAEASAAAAIPPPGAPGVAGDEGAEAEDEDAEEAEEEPVDRYRTLGRACVYGANGEVLYAPDDVSCERHDDRSSLDRAPAKAPLSREPTGAGPERAAPARPARGRCIYGPHDEVVHAPRGAYCAR